MLSVDPPWGTPAHGRREEQGGMDEDYTGDVKYTFALNDLTHLGKSALHLKFCDQLILSAICDHKRVD